MTCSLFATCDVSFFKLLVLAFVIVVFCYLLFVLFI